MKQINEEHMLSHPPALAINLETWPFKILGEVNEALL